MEKIYLNNFLLSYNNIQNLICYLQNNYKDKFLFDKTLCTSYFKYPVNSYKIGSGKKHVILLGATHRL